MYNITRQDAADSLWISTRSVDRYIKSWKLRAKKEWKTILINSFDLENINKWPKKKQEIITPNRTENQSFNNKPINTNEVNFIYNDLKNIIKDKDLKIEELSVKLGKAEEIVKSSISMIEFKKSQYLLSQSKSSQRYFLL